MSTEIFKLKYFERWGKWRNLAVNYIWEDLWWKRRNEYTLWLEKLIRGKACEISGLGIIFVLPVGIFCYGGIYKK